MLGPVRRRWVFGLRLTSIYGLHLHSLFQTSRIGFSSSLLGLRLACSSWRNMHPRLLVQARRGQRQRVGDTLGSSYALVLLFGHAVHRLLTRCATAVLATARVTWQLGGDALKTLRRNTVQAKSQAAETFARRLHTLSIEAAVGRRRMCHSLLLCLWKETVLCCPSWGLL